MDVIEAFNISLYSNSDDSDKDIQVESKEINIIDKSYYEIINIMLRMVKDPNFKNEFIGPKKTPLPIEGYSFKLFMERLCFEDGFYRSLLKTSLKNPQKIIEPLKHFQNMIELPLIQYDLGDKYQSIKNGIIKLRERLLQNLF